jgi:hypothetical protein
MQHQRLTIATRIHHLLLREIGEGIDVGKMLKRAPYATEVLYVCAASRQPELRELGRQFEALTRAHNVEVVQAMERAERKGPAASGWPSGAASGTDVDSSHPQADGTRRAPPSFSVKSSFAPWNG